jgi:photosystem II stability/assembly factor-like uncharacterized protein
MAKRVLLGTTKGVFLLDPAKGYAVSGPLCDGWPINHVIGDPATGRLWAAGGGDWHGAGIWRSEDGGESWSLTKLSNGKFDEWLTNDPAMAEQMGVQPSPPAPFTGKINTFWSLCYAHGVLYAGGKPAQLLRSLDGGVTWETLHGLTDHPSAEGWEPGAAGLVLHSILTDPGDAQKLFVGISAAGFFASEDGGKSWERRVKRSNADAVRTGSEDIGYCVHNIQRAPDGTIWQQNHWGTYRSTDEGRTWNEVGQGLPSTFGFPIGAHPGDASVAYVLPLNGDSMGRFPPEAQCAVWRTQDGGESWQAMRNGLPQTGCYFTVLRQAMATDASAPGSVYFGTNSGSVFASLDQGESWSEIARHLPTVLAVEVLAG